MFLGYTFRARAARKDALIRLAAVRPRGGGCMNYYEVRVLGTTTTEYLRPQAFCALSADDRDGRSP